MGRGTAAWVLERPAEGGVERTVAFPRVKAPSAARARSETSETRETRETR